MPIDAPLLRSAGCARRCVDCLLGGAARACDLITLRRVALAGLLGVSALALVGLAFAGSPQRLAAGTTIGGVDVGGLTTAEATHQLEAAAASAERQPVTFTAAGRKWK